jgi:hypothetical protein
MARFTEQIPEAVLAEQNAPESTKASAQPKAAKAKVAAKEGEGQLRKKGYAPHLRKGQRTPTTHDSRKR